MDSRRLWSSGRDSSSLGLGLVYMERFRGLKEVSEFRGFSRISSIESTGRRLKVL